MREVELDLPEPVYRGCIVAVVDARDARTVALDIETSGLDPSSCVVLAIGIVGDGIEVTLFSDNERELLLDLEGLVRSFGSRTTLVTWNGDEFDLPFLGARFAIHEVSSMLSLSPRGTLGKYGKPLFRAEWGPLRHVDLAPAYREVAHRRNVQWSLKPVARALLGVQPIEVDRTGEAIARMRIADRNAYVLSDALATYRLALVEPGHSAVNSAASR